MVTKTQENRHSIYLALGVFATALLIYWLSAHAMGRVSSPQMAYFDHLAVAFSRGQLHLENPPATHDLDNHDGRWYVPFPPLPALLMLPWAALCGLQAINTVSFSVGMGALMRALDEQLSISAQPTNCLLGTTLR